MENLTHWKQTRNAEYLGSYDLACGIDKNDKPIYKEIIATIDKIVIDEEVIDVASKINEKKKLTVLYFKNGLKKMIINSTNKKSIESATGTPFIEKWAGKQICIYVQTGVYMPGTKKADNITTDALRIKSIPKRICSVCGKIIEEKIYNASISKYNISLCSKECAIKAGKIKIDEENNENE